jgi:hypothetical protein
MADESLGLASLGLVDPTPSPCLATAAALNSSAGRNHIAEGLRYLEVEIGSGRITERVTAYYAYFVAQALAHHSRGRALAYVRGFYGPIAQTYGTIYEKTSGSASLAHGWSVAVASLCITDAGNRSVL